MYDVSSEGDGLRTKVLPILNKIYKNIDIRAVLVKRQDNQWYSAFLKIHLTKESEDRVKKNP
jgi:hypothetical protein